MIIAEQFSQPFSCEYWRNVQRLKDYKRKKQELANLRYCQAEAIIVRALRCHSQPVIDAALVRARRVCDGRGTVETAVYHAVNIDC
jgi:hypothetical protein